MRRARQVSALLFGLVIVLNAAVVGCRAAEAPVATDPVVVHTASGTVRGLVAEGHRLFAGIPYAAPPVGSLRFAAPEPAASWPGERDATRPGPRCVQDPDADLEHGDNSGEDCLTLNVWTPPVGKDLRPVMVWIHGGGFVNGSSDVYDASRLASRGDIVVVTVNYRLGTLGFLAHPALEAPARSATTASPTSRRRCGGCATTSPRSAATRSGSRSRASRRAGHRCATTWSRRDRRGCSTRWS